MTRPHTNPPDTAADSEWLPLAPGQLTAMAAQRQTRIRRRRLWSMTALAVTAAGLAMFLVRSSERPAAPPDPIHAGVACSVVRRELPDLHRGVLPVERARQLERHLAECPPCRALRARLQASAAVETADSTPPGERSSAGSRPAGNRRHGRTGERGWFLRHRNFPNSRLARGNRPADTPAMTSTTPNAA